MLENESLKVIDEICKDLGIEEKKLSFGWIRELKKDGKTCHIVRNTFDLNPAGSYDIVNDKYATYEVLSNNDVNIIKHIMIFNEKSRKEYAGNLEQEIDNAFLELGNKLVIKANFSSEGKEVYLVNDKKEAIEVVKDIFNRNFASVSVCPFEEIECEYRVIVLDGEILYIYKKIATGWKHNLSNGATIDTNIEKDEVLPMVKDLALRSAKAVNIRFASVDISKKKTGEVFIMEINGSVCMSKFIQNAENGREIAKGIYKKAIQKMF